jgi:hypothetical protein
MCFLTKAIRRHGTPEKSTIDGSEANAATIRRDHEAHGTAIAIRQVKYLQRLRSSSQPLQSRERKGSAFETEEPPEFIDTEASCMPFLLQYTKRHQAAHDMMLLRLCRAGLTACQSQLILADSDDFLDRERIPYTRRTSAADSVRRLVV